MIPFAVNYGSILRFIAGFDSSVRELTYEIRHSSNFMAYLCFVFEL